MENNKIENFLLISACIFLVLFIVFGYLEKGTFFAITSDLGKIFFTLYISYVVTKYFAEKSATEELRDLAESSGRRVFLLSSNIRELADEIMGYEPDGDRSRLHYRAIASQMTRLASQAELSFQDMQQMAKLNISIPSLIKETSMIEGNYRRWDIVSCPYCSNEQEIHIRIKPDAAEYVMCSACHNLFVTHRMADRSVAVSRSGKSESIHCPSCSREKEVFLLEVNLDEIKYVKCDSCHGLFNVHRLSGGSIRLVPPERPIRKLVLVAEDNPMTVNVIGHELEFLGYDYSVAKTGVEVIEIAALQVPDLIIMDISMPSIDGWEATSMIRSNPQTESIPILAVTARALPKDKKRSLVSGCNAYMAKPFTHKELQSMIKKLLPKTDT